MNKKTGLIKPIKPDRFFKPIYEPDKTDLSGNTFKQKRLPNSSRQDKQYSLEKPLVSDYNENILKKEALGSIRQRKTLEVGWIKSKNYKEGVSGWKLDPQGSSFPMITNGTAVPTSTPSKVGDIFIDTVNGKIYIASGTTSAEWRALN